MKQRIMLQVKYAVLDEIQASVKSATGDPYAVWNQVWELTTDLADVYAIRDLILRDMFATLEYDGRGEW